MRCNAETPAASVRIPAGIEAGRPGLTDPLQNEHGVVHGQAEEHDEHEEGQPIDDVAGGAEGKEVLGPGVLEYRGQDPVGRADRHGVEGHDRGSE